MAGRSVYPSHIFYLHAMRYIFLIFFLLGIQTCFAQSVKHVVVIGVDGMSPDGILNANTPNMDKMIKNGAHTFEGQAVMPTSSSPNWASMIMGAGPEQHGITSNAWKRKDVKEKSYCNGKVGETWPTIFKVLKEQRPKVRIGIFHHWISFGRLVERGVANRKEFTFSKVNTISRAATYFRIAKPELIFIHLDHVDHAGHKYGHGTPEYYESVSEADMLIGRMQKAIQRAGLDEETIIIITSDHGGKGHGHGGDSPEEINIPWIITGPQVSKGKTITQKVNTYDTAATIASLLKLKSPECWIAKPIKLN